MTSPYVRTWRSAGTGGSGRASGSVNQPVLGPKTIAALRELLSSRCRGIVPGVAGIYVSSLPISPHMQMMRYTTDIVSSPTGADRVLRESKTRDVSLKLKSKTKGPRLTRSRKPRSGFLAQSRSLAQRTCSTAPLV